MRCNRPECGLGEIDDEGFCSVCDEHPLPQAAPTPPRPAANTGVAQIRPDPWWGLDLVRGDLVPADAAARNEPEALAVSESHRYCANPECPAEVGRGHDGAPGRIKGYCAECGRPFDFSTPQATTGQVIAGRYEVRRVLGTGGFGKTYLVRDRNLGADVVLKSLWQSVAQTAVLERDALVGLRHDSIVRILSYEPEGPYLVLEYVPGTRLSARADDRLEVILGHGLQILQALDYLHARGLLHCDVNPSNIMRFAEESADGLRDRVRLIDFGAVRSLRDTSPVSIYTADYAPPGRDEPGERGGRSRPPDPEREHPTAGFDLFCLGRTLQELCRRQLRDRLSDPGVEPLNRLLLRATDIGLPQRRFRSARQFAEQLSGVIRQVVAAPPADRRVTRSSVLFGSMVEPLHGGLGAPRPIGHWVAARASGRTVRIAEPFASPTHAAIAAALPTPLEDPDDDPRTAQQVRSALAECRAELRRGSAGGAEEALRGSGLPSWHWLHAWYSGLTALTRDAAGAAKTAAGFFEAVRDMLPGELIPLLALGLCAESAGDLTVARLHYQTVADTAPALGAAGFGLARVHLLDGRRAQAVRAAEQLAREFRFEREASIAAVRLLAAVRAAPDADRQAPGDADPVRADDRLAALDVDPRDQTMLRLEIQYARFVAEGDGMALSEMLREAAKHAATERDFTAMIDLANRLRPEIQWRIPGFPRRIRRTVRAEHVN